MSSYSSSSDSDARRRAMFANMRAHFKDVAGRTQSRLTGGLHYVAGIPGAAAAMASHQKERAIGYVASADPGQGANWLADQVSLAVESVLRANLDHVYQAAEGHVAEHTVAMQDRLRRSLQGKIATGQRVVVGNRIDPISGQPWTPTVNVFITKEQIRNLRPRNKETGYLKLRTGFSSSPLAANLEKTMKALKDAGVSDEMAARMAENLTIGNSLVEAQKLRRERDTLETQRRAFNRAKGSESSYRPGSGFVPS